MPCYDEKQLKEIANLDLPQIATAMRDAQKAVADATHDWGAPFAESKPDGWMSLYGETKKEWIAARSAFQQILLDAAARVDQSAQGMLKISTNYALAEEAGVERLRGILRQLG